MSFHRCFLNVGFEVQMGLMNYSMISNPLFVREGGVIAVGRLCGWMISQRGLRSLFMGCQVQRGSSSRMK